MPTERPLLHSEGRLQDSPVNIRLGCKWQSVAKALAYNNSVLITNVKRFIVQAQGEMDREDKLVTVGQYYKIVYICNSYKNAGLVKGNLTLKIL